MNETQLNALRIVLSYMEEDLADWTPEEKKSDNHVVDAVKILNEMVGI